MIQPATNKPTTTTPKPSRPKPPTRPKGTHEHLDDHSPATSTGADPATSDPTAVGAERPGQGIPAGANSPADSRAQAAAVVL